MARKRMSWRFLGARWGEFMAAHQRVLQIVASLALLVMLSYLVVRIVATAAGANPVSFGLLLAAEVLALIATALYVFETWSVPRLEQPEPLPLSTDIVIATYDEPLTVLEPTIVGSLRVKGVGDVWVLDDGRREEVREYCEEVGARYVTRPSNEHAKAGNINNALPLFTSELILVLDADHVPARNIITAMSGYFRDPRVALVQSPHNFRNLDSAQHRTPDRHEQSLFFRVLQPARDRHEASFWCGSSALIRVSALKQIGGVATETVSEDLHTTVRLQQRGHRARYHNEVLATGLAPHTIADFLLQRYRWAQGTVQVLLSKESPIFGRGWAWLQRLHYVNNLIYYLLPFQRLAYVAVLLLVLLMGWLPVGTASIGFLVLIAVSLVASNVASTGLARGMRDATEGTSYTWITAETHLRATINTVLGIRIPFRVTPKALNALGLREKLVILRLPLVVIALLAGAWILRAAQQTWGSLPFGLQLPGELTTLAFIAATAFVILEILMIAPSVVRELARTQKRALWRFSVHLEGEAGGEPVTVTDVHESGVSLVGPNGLAQEGDALPLTLAAYPGTDLPPINVVMSVRRVIGTGPHSVYGGPVTWNTSDDRFGVVDLCYAHLSHEQATQPIARPA